VGLSAGRTRSQETTSRGDGSGTSAGGLAGAIVVVRASRSESRVLRQSIGLNRNLFVIEPLQ
jgi:hypothetical protein